MGHCGQGLHPEGPILNWCMLVHLSSAEVGSHSRTMASLSRGSSCNSVWPLQAPLHNSLQYYQLSSSLVLLWSQRGANSQPGDLFSQELRKCWISPSLRFHGTLICISIGDKTHIWRKKSFCSFLTIVSCWGVISQCWNQSLLRSICEFPQY